MPPAASTNPALGMTIKKLREAHGLTQEELASQAGTTVGTVSRMETAKSAPAWATVVQIIKAMDVSLLELARAVEKVRRSLQLSAATPLESGSQALTEARPLALAHSHGTQKSMKGGVLAK